MTPPIQQSPTVPQPAPGDSDVRPLTKKELRLLKEAEAKATEETARAKRLKNFIWGTVGIVIATVIVTVSTLAFGQSAIDKQVAPLEKRLDRVEVVVQNQQLENVRNSTMLEMLVKAQGMTPPPPAPKVSVPDGGSP